MVREFRAPRPAKDVEHSTVFRDEGRFSGWPYVMGFWETGGGELIANFLSVDVDYGDPESISHDRFGERRARGDGGRMGTIRSIDRGRTWTPPEFDAYPKAVDDGQEALADLSEWGPFDFLDPNLLVSVRSTNFGTPASRSLVRVSRDAGRSWTPAAQVPLEGLYSLSAMHSTLVRPDGRCLLFLTSTDEGGWNRRPLVYASTDGGAEFHFLSFITPERDPFAAADGDWTSSYRFGGHRWFYPRGVMLPNGRILCTLRCQRDPRGVMWTELYCSDDGGLTWEFLSRANDFGAPGSLVAMSDGRLVLVYGHRLKPHGIRAVVSENDGRSWGSEIVLRDDGGSWDLGYPNAFEAEPGKIGTIYYFNSRDDSVQANGGVRHIAQSIFTPD